MLPKGPVELQWDFYEKVAVSILGCACYFTQDLPSTLPTSPASPSPASPILPSPLSTMNESACHYIDYISSILNHDATYVKDCITLLCDYLKMKNYSIWLDCGPHFRNYELLFFFLRQLPEKCQDIESVEVSFFTEHHGKSPIDAHFSYLSRSLEEVTRRSRISNLVEFRTAMSSYFAAHQKTSSVELRVYSDADRDQTSNTVNVAMIADQHGYRVNITENYLYMMKRSTVTLSEMSWNQSSYFYSVSSSEPILMSCNIRARAKNKRTVTRTAQSVIEAKKKKKGHAGETASSVGKITRSRLEKLKVKFSQ